MPRLGAVERQQAVAIFFEARHLADDQIVGLLLRVDRDGRGAGRAEERLGGDEGLQVGELVRFEIGLQDPGLVVIAVGGDEEGVVGFGEAVEIAFAGG